MSAAARRWLPPGAASPALDRDVAALAADWAQAWFGVAVRGAGGLRADAPEVRGPVHVMGDDVAIGVAGDPPGELALGLRGGNRGAADRALIDRVGDAALDDLRRRVRAMAGGDRAEWTGPVDRPPWQPARWQCFADAGGRLSVTIYLGEGCFVASWFDRMPPPPPSTPLTALSRAVATGDVRLSARLGRCTLPLGEMRGMVVGDTLRFDAAIDAALPVVVDGAATGIAAARVVREAAQWTLHIETCAFQRAA